MGTVVKGLRVLLPRRQVDLEEHMDTAPVFRGGWLAGEAGVQGHGHTAGRVEPSLEAENLPLGALNRSPRNRGRTRGLCSGDTACLGLASEHRACEERPSLLLARCWDRPPGAGKEPRSSPPPPHPTEALGRLPGAAAGVCAPESPVLHLALLMCKLPVKSRWKLAADGQLPG